MATRMTQKITMFLFLLVSFFSFENLFSQTSDADLKEAIKNKAFLVDVRTAEEFAKGSVEGAVNIHIDEIESRLGEFKDKTTILTFCNAGNRGGKAAALLQKNGFKNALNGGGRQNLQKLVDEVKEAHNAELKEAVKKGAFLVDVRTAEEFAKGSVEGAINIPIDQIESRLGEFKDKTTILTFCNGGNRGGKAAAILQKNGFKNALNGGGRQNLQKIVDESKE